MVFRMFSEEPLPQTLPSFEDSKELGQQARESDQTCGRLQSAPCCVT